MGQWYEVAVVSTCPHYMRRKQGEPVIVALELQHVASEQNFTMTATAFRSDSHQWQHTQIETWSTQCNVCVCVCLQEWHMQADVHSL